MRDIFCTTTTLSGLALDFVIFSLLALSAWLVLRSGRISLGQQAFFGLGAYTAALATAVGGWSLLPALGLGMGVGALAGGLLAALTARLSGLQFAVGTLAFAELVRLGLSAWSWQRPNAQGQLRGPDGVNGFREIRWMQENQVSPEDYLIIAATLLALVLLFWAVVSRTRLGLATRAIGFDEGLAAASAIPVHRLRVTVSAAAGALAALSGGLFAHNLTFLDPAAFDPMLGIHAVGYALIGGMASVAGPLLGAAFDIGLLQATAGLASWRMVVFGGLVALFLRWRPRGLLDEALIDRLAGLWHAWRCPSPRPVFRFLTSLLKG